MSSFNVSVTGIPFNPAYVKTNNNSQVKTLVASSVATAVQTVSSQLNVLGGANTNSISDVGDTTLNNVTITGTARYDGPIVENSNCVATTASVAGLVNSAVSNMVNSAPSALNQLNELASALNNDANFAGTVTTALAGKGGLTSTNTWTNTNTFSGSLIVSGGVNVANKLSSLSSNIASLDVSIADHESRVVAVEGTLPNKRDYSDVAFSNSLTLGGVNLNSRLTTNESAISALQITDATQSTDITNIKSNVSILQGNIVSHNTRLTNAESAIYLVQGNVTLLQSNVADIQSNISTLQSNYSTLSGTVTTNSSDISTLKGNVTQFHSNIASLESTTATQASSITSIISVNTSQQTSINSLLTRATALEGNVTSAQTDISSLQSSVSQNTTDINSHGTILTGVAWNNSMNEFNYGINAKGGITLPDSTSLSTRLSSLDSSVSSQGSSISSLTTSLSSKAADNAVVKLTGDQSIGGIKNFTSKPQYNSAGLATESYVDSAISSLIGGASTAYDTLGEIATQLAEDTNSITTILTAVGNCVDLSSTQVITGNKSFGNVTVGGNLLIGSADVALSIAAVAANVATNTTNISTNTTNISTNSSAISTLQGKTSAVSYATGNTSITGNLYIGTELYVNGSSLTSLIPPTVIVDTSLSNGSANAISNDAVYDALQSKQNTLVYDTTPTLGSGNVMTSSSIYTALSNKANNVFDIVPTSTSGNLLTSGTIYTALSAKQNSLTYDSVVTDGSTNAVNSNVVYQAIQTRHPLTTVDSTSGGTSGSSNLITSGAVYSGLSGKMNTMTVDTTATLSSSNLITSNGVAYAVAGIGSTSYTWSAEQINTNNSILSRPIESISSGTVTTNAISLTYSSQNAVISIAPSSANNISLTLTSVPTSRTAIYNLTFLIDVSSYKQFINSVTVNGSSVTPKAVGGLANVTVNSSSSMVIQTISIHMTNSTVSNVYTSVASMF